MLNYEHPIYNCQLNTKYLILAPCSEVCMYIRVADKLVIAEIIPDGPYTPVVQLYDALEPDKRISSPILLGEAGFYQDEQRGIYYYPPVINEESQYVGVSGENYASQ